MNKRSEDNFIAQGWNAYKKAVPSPLISALLVGGGIYGLGRLAWGPSVETVRAIARYPGRKMSGLTSEEWDIAMDNLKQHSTYRKWLPAVFGAAATAGVLAGHYKGNKSWGGLGSWNPDNKLKPDYNSDTVYAGTSTGSGQYKESSDMYSYDGYVNDTDFSQVVNISKANSLFSNDPHLQNNPYVRNMGTAIVNNAAIQAGTQQPTLGNIFDSATQKISNKLSFQGLTEIGVKSVISNATARLFTGALGAMVDLNPAARSNIIDAGTWAGTIISILE